jgi:hypothetical protein
MENSLIKHDHEHDHAHGYRHPVQPELKQTRRTREEMSHIKGWGADLDHKNRPAVPMERTPPRYTPAGMVTPPAQEQHVEVLVSNERPGITQLHGTVQPPSGLSGMLRRAAFKFSENDIRHWLILLGAGHHPGQGPEHPRGNGDQVRVAAQQGRAGEEGGDCRGCGCSRVLPAQESRRRSVRRPVLNRATS